MSVLGCHATVRVPRVPTLLNIVQTYLTPVLKTSVRIDIQGSVYKNAVGLVLVWRTILS